MVRPEQSYELGPAAPQMYGLPSWLLANATARAAAPEGAPAVPDPAEKLPALAAAAARALAARSAASRRSRARRRSRSWRRRSAATARLTCLVRRWW